MQKSVQEVTKDYACRHEAACPAEVGDVLLSMQRTHSSGAVV